MGEIENQLKQAKSFISHHVLFIILALPVVRSQNLTHQGALVSDLKTTIVLVYMYCNSKSSPYT